MIINSEGGVKQTIGQTTEYKTTIDIENLDFIATLLSSNLYSKPEDSFIREIVSNGWDSHVEANNTNTPLLVRIRSNASYGYDITIRDYGTGLSKTAFENIYCKIGTSTKRSSNSYLGCFGIGKFATMAVSKASYITSYFDGTARLYVMTKDGNNITTNLVSEKATTEANGLEVVVKNVTNINSYKEAVARLAFFPNVYTDGVFNECNNIKVKRFKNFSFATRPFEDKLLLGNVLYPLDEKILPSELSSFYNNLKSSGLVFNFNIGELSVTPNRESIIYNSKVNDIIINRIKAAKEEIANIVSPLVAKNYENPLEYYDISSKLFCFDFINNKKLELYGNYYYPKFAIQDLNLDITFYNRKVNPDIVIRVGRLRPLNIKAVSDGTRMWKDKYPWQASRIIDKNEVPILVIKDDEKITKYVKEYLLNTYTNLLVCKTSTYQEYTEEFSKHWLPWNRTALTMEEEFILKKCWEFYTKRWFYIDFNTDSNFTSFKEQMKKEAKENAVTLNEKVILTVYDYGRDFGYKRHCNSYFDALRYIKSLKKGILIKNLNSTSLASVAGSLGYVTIAANKKVVDLLNKEPLKCKISEDVIYTHKKLVLYKAIIESKLYEHLSDYSRFWKDTLPKELQKFLEECAYLYSFIPKYSVLAVLDKVTLDEDLYNKCITLINCKTSYVKTVTQLDAEASLGVRDIIAYIIMKNKLYKIGYDCYKKVKRNKIIKALCEK